MKKIIGWILIIVISIGSVLIVKEKSDIYDIGVNDTQIEMKIRCKGLKDSVDFTMNEKSIFLAFSNRILCIPKEGEPYNLIEDDKLDIRCLEINGDKLYFLTKNEIMSVDITNRSVEECLGSIPNNGDYKDVMIKSYKEYLFISISSATNSGVVGSDNQWLNDNKNIHDISPKDIILNKNKNGAFVSVGTSNTENEVIKGEAIGNSSIIIFNTNTKKIETFAWGIRNVKGMDIATDGRVFTVVGGMENRGIRAVENDSDYIYEIKKDYWYGFPDFSGGDPLNSPKFQSKSLTVNTPLMAKYPMIPPAPIYEHSDLNTLKWIVIDDDGAIDENKILCLYFYDIKDNSILYSNIQGTPQKLIALKENCVVSNMKIINDEFYILDNKHGFLFTISKKSKSN
ncbi:hypothetical protein [Clostridium sp.]|uniref:hypothetical protein n=1 Tax=Clostridium sp. TaxID=1506 RepID=UPI003217C392